MRIVLIATALLAPGTAFAATGDIGCIEAKIGAAAVQRIGDGVVAAADKGTDLGRTLDADREALIAARDVCRTANNWSFGAVQAAVSFTQARATGLGAETAINADGLNISTIAARYAALPVVDRRSLIGKVSPAVIRAIAAIAATQVQRRHVLLYFAALAGLEFYPADFAAA